MNTIGNIAEGDPQRTMVRAQNGVSKMSGLSGDEIGQAAADVQEEEQESGTGEVDNDEHIDIQGVRN